MKQGWPGPSQHQISHVYISWCALSWQDGCGVVWGSEVKQSSTPSVTIHPADVPFSHLSLWCLSISFCHIIVHTSLFSSQRGDYKLQLKAVVSSTMRPWRKHRRGKKTTAEDKGSDKCQGLRGDLWAAPLVQNSLRSHSRVALWAAKSLSICSVGGLPVTMCRVRRHAQTIPPCS